MGRQSRCFGLGLLALSIAVALWNFGYKIGQFDYQTGPTPRIQAQKALLELRSSPSLTSVQNLRHRTRSQFESGPDGFLVRDAHPRSYLSSYHSRIPSTPRVLPFFHTALPLRSPPARVLA